MCVTRLGQQQAVVLTVVLEANKKLQEAISARGVEKIVPFQRFRRCQVNMFSGRIKEKYSFFLMATIVNVTFELNDFLS